jgi:hypothetical protein
MRRSAAWGSIRASLIYLGILYKILIDTDDNSIYHYHHAAPALGAEPNNERIETMATIKQRRKLSAADREAIQRDSLTRAQSGQSWTNYAAIISGFAAKGVPADQILPRENVFTFNAWKALGRVVRKGEHGVKVISWAPIERKERDKATGEERKVSGRRPVSATVFHVSQTDAIGGA